MDLLEQLKRDEGLRLQPYRDSVGKLTIGYGRNLDDVGISGEEAEILLEHDAERAWKALYSRLPWVINLDEVRRAVLVNMAFNLGIAGLLQFKNTLALAESGKYREAAAEMLKSKWAQQVGERAARLARQMESGQWQ